MALHLSCRGLAFAAFLGLVLWLVLDTSRQPEQLVSFAGTCMCISILFACSKHRRAVSTELSGPEQAADLLSLCLLMLPPPKYQDPPSFIMWLTPPLRLPSPPLSKASQRSQCTPELGLTVEELLNAKRSPASLCRIGSIEGVGLGQLGTLSIEEGWGEPRQMEVTLRPDPETQFCLPSDDLGPTATACPRLVKSYVGHWLDLAHPCPLSQAHCCQKPGLF